MSDSPPSPEAGLATQILRIDQVCNQYEAAWRGPCRPRIEDFLGAIPAADRRALLGELISVELEYRRSRGEDCRPEEYLARFPELERSELVEILAGDPSGEPAVPPGIAGRYVLVRFHARGGLGEVHVAFDQELRRRVALKRIRKQHHANPDSRRRFLTEAEITSRLEHPGIVPVYGLEPDADGLPCYAMRFIEGETFREALQRFHAAERGGQSLGERRLALRQFLTRFVTVCQTVAYAHSQGVIHRDLKPANILLGKYGETLVVDWGLAKVLNAGEPSAANQPEELATSAGAGEGITQVGQILGTPAYMSPEQAAGRWDILGPASDIYSLGTTLYALLTGRAPFQGDTPVAAAGLAARGDFPPPRRVHRHVPRALEAICLKAMAARPEDRYPTALDLAADVEHWLADEPVAAYREAWPARLGRWGRQHKPLMAGLTAVLVAAVVFLAIADIRSVREQARTTAQWQRAETSYRLAREVLDQYRRQVADDPRLRSGPLEDLRRTALEAELTFFQKFVELRGEEPAFQAERGRAFQRLGDVTQELASTMAALEHYRQAQIIFEGLARDHPAVAEYQGDLARCQQTLGRLYQTIKKNEAAEQAYRTALALLRDLADRDVAAPAPQADLARCFQDLGSFYLRTPRGERRAQALHAFQDALRIQMDLVRQYPDIPAYQADLAKTQDDLGTWYWTAPQWPDAERAYRDALGVQEKLVRRWPDVPNYRATLASIHHHLARLYWQVPKLAEAEEAYGHALRILNELAEHHPLVTQYQVERALTSYNLGRLLNARPHARGAESEKAYLAALAVQKDLARNHPRIPRYQFDLARTLHNLGILYGQLARWTEALQTHRDALGFANDLVARYPDAADYAILVGQIHTGLSNLAREADRLDDADAERTQAQAVFEKLLRQEPENAAVLHWNRQARAGGALTQARRGNLTQAIAAAQALAGETKEIEGNTLTSLVRVYAWAARVDPAGSQQREAHATHAMELLRRYAPHLSEAAWLTKDLYFEVLRDREDFRTLVAEAAAREQEQAKRK